jgi:hypothetical protein
MRCCHSHAHDERGLQPKRIATRCARVSGELRRTQESLKIALLTIDKLKVELAYLRRMKYGRSSEQPRTRAA